MFGKVTNRSAISTLNLNERLLIDPNDIFYGSNANFQENSREVIKHINSKYLTTIKADKKSRYIYAAEEFKELLMINK